MIRYASGSQKAKAIAPAAMVQSMWMNALKNPRFSHTQVIASTSTRQRIFTIIVVLRPCHSGARSLRVPVSLDLNH
jgi:hypothetical protein